MPGEKPKKRPSLEDVAKAAGVNYLYTQRVLSGNTEIPQATQEKVFNAVKELGYVKTHHPGQHFNKIDDRGLPVAVAVLTDKLAVIKGQPTSIHLAMTASVNHRDLMKDLKERDVTPVNDEQIPDGANP